MIFPPLSQRYCFYWIYSKRDFCTGSKTFKFIRKDILHCFTSGGQFFIHLYYVRIELGNAVSHGVDVYTQIVYFSPNNDCGNNLYPGDSVV